MDVTITKILSDPLRSSNEIDQRFEESETHPHRISATSSRIVAWRGRSACIDLGATRRSGRAERNLSLAPRRGGAEEAARGRVCVQRAGRHGILARKQNVLKLPREGGGRALFAARLDAVLRGRPPLFRAATQPPEPPSISKYPG